MPHTKTALILMMAFVWPAATQALGLGEIHVDSALNERLAAEIDIVGATADDLAGITASVANSETFLRFGVDRPAFLSSATFKIAMDSKGQPVLAIRSKDPFTEPLIDILIDVRWHSGELVRHYTLLLDPPSFASAARVAEAAPIRSEPGVSFAQAAAAPAAAEPIRENPKPAPQPTQPASPPVSQTISRETVKVAAGATLHGIASRIGSRSEPGLEKMMIAIFRANPNAFEGNINRLRLGAELAIPSAAEVSAISTADADSEVHAQMESWRTSTKFVGSAKPAGLAVAAPVPAPLEAEIHKEPAATREAPASKSAAGASDALVNPSVAADDAALGRRVQDLENELKNVKSALDQENGTILDLRARAAFAEKTQAVTAVPPTVRSGHASVGPWITAAMALALGAIGVLYGWRRRQTPNPEVSPAAAKSQNLGAAEVATETVVKPEMPPAVPEVQIKTPSPATAVQPQPAALASPDEQATLVAAVLDGIDLESLDASYRLEAGGLEHTVNLNIADTANLPAATMKIRASDINAETMPLESPRFVIGMPEPSTSEHPSPDSMLADQLNADTAKLQYTAVDVDGAEHHIHMPSILREKEAFKDRRTSLVDVLKIAVEREPSRRDLRMKLLETFYTAAAANRQAFLEVALYLAGERGDMTNGEWEKIAGMGRQIAADNDLFAANTDPADDDDLENCA